MEIWEMILVGGMGAAIATAIIKFLESVIIWIMNRKAKKNDDSIKDKKSFEYRISKEIEDIKAGNRTILRDRIRYLSSVYKAKNKISYNEREDLIEMHNVYHNNSDGNGNLDALMDEIMHLPLE